MEGGLLAWGAALTLAMNPLGNAPFFLEAVAGRPLAARLRAALETGAAAGLVAAAAAALGGPLLAAYGLGVEHVRLAGGIVLLAVALARLLGIQTRLGDRLGHLYPVAAPMIAGPATVSLAVTLSATMGFTAAALASLTASLVVSGLLALASLLPLKREYMDAAGKYTALITLLIAVKLITASDPLLLAHQPQSTTTLE